MEAASPDYKISLWLEGPVKVRAQQKILSIFADCPVPLLCDCHVIRSNSAFVKCWFRERRAEGVGSHFPPVCLWSVFFS